MKKSTDFIGGTSMRLKVGVSGAIVLIKEVENVPAITRPSSSLYMKEILQV
jgi:hypothetical protein